MKIGDYVVVKNPYGAEVLAQIEQSCDRPDCGFLNSQLPIVGAGSHEQLVREAEQLIGLLTTALAGPVIAGETIALDENDDEGDYDITYYRLVDGALVPAGDEDEDEDDTMDEMGSDFLLNHAVSNGDFATYDAVAGAVGIETDEGE